MERKGPSVAERLLLLFIGEDTPWYFRLFVLLLFICGAGMGACVYIECIVDTPRAEMLYTTAFGYFADGFKITLGAILGALTGVIRPKSSSTEPQAKE